jgi:uncharacterized protein (DUF433 family)
MENKVMQRKEIGQYLVIDPEICHSQLTFKGTRVPVDTIFVYLAKGYSIDMLINEWPRISREAIKEAIDLAAQALQKEYVEAEELAKSGAS